MRHPVKGGVVSQGIVTCSTLTRVTSANTSGRIHFRNPYDYRHRTPAFAVHNIERALAFYALLGITESFCLTRDDGSPILIYLHVAGSRFIEIFPNAPEPDPNRIQSFMHLCLLTDDLHAMVENLRAAGIQIDQEPKVGLNHNWQAWVKDPDGNAIELMQLDESSPQRKIARAAVHSL